MSDRPDHAGFALVRVPVAPVHAESQVSSAQTTQTVFGRPVVLGEHRGDWYAVRTTPDGYAGWMHAGYLRVIEAGSEQPAGPQAAGLPVVGDPGARAGGASALRVSLGCVVRVGERTLRLPLGAWVAADAPVLEGEAIAMDGLAGRFPGDGEAVLRTAARYFGSTSYQWGGVTPWGADCSGFVQAVYALHGVDLPRDAWQQAAVGEDVGAEPAAHVPGDLVFFSEREDGRVTHVGLAAGGGRLLHVALGRGGYAEDALVAGRDAYAAALRTRLVGARRVLGTRAGGGPTG